MVNSYLIIITVRILIKVYRPGCKELVLQMTANFNSKINEHVLIVDLESQKRIG
jgi:hypothetical protein